MKFVEYSKHVNAKQHVIDWVIKHLKEETDITEGEHIIDFLVSDKAPKRLERATFMQMKKETEKWNAALIKKGEHIKEEKSDTEIVLDFGDGFKIVKLIGKKAFEREGYLMRHCVASYYGKNAEVYSLRDKDNIPHCTIEKDKQIKGKGNGDISQKYIHYVVKFLEHVGMKIGDNEMKHLGYVNITSILDEIHEDVKTMLFQNKYFPIYKKDKIINQNGEKIVHIGLLDFLPLIEKTGDNIKIAFDISALQSNSVEWIRKKTNNIKKNQAARYNSCLETEDYSHLVVEYGSNLAVGDYSRLAAGSKSHLVAGNYSYLAAGGRSCLATEGWSNLAAGEWSNLAAGNCSNLAAGDDSYLAAGGWSNLAAGSKSYLAAGEDSHLVAGVNSRLAAGGRSCLSTGDCSHLAAGDDSRLAAGSKSHLAAGDESFLVAGSCSRLAAGDYSRLAAGYESYLVAGNESHLAAGNESHLIAGGHSFLAAGDKSNLAAGEESFIAAGDNSRLYLGGKNSFGIAGKYSKIKGKKGSGFALGVYDENDNLIDIKSAFIDGEKYKEDTLYWIKNGEIVEYIEK